MKPILIVEDESIMRESLRDWLKDSGYEVETAEEGEQALKMLEKKEYGIAILDLRLPGKDGIDVLQQAKLKQPSLKGVIITAYPSVPSAVRTMKEGAVDYLAKPIDLKELDKLIQRTLRLATTEKLGSTGDNRVSEGQAAVFSPERIPVHLKRGKAFFKAGNYTQALEEFEGIIRISPGNIESWVWSGKTRETLMNRNTEAGLTEAERPRECLWMRMGIVPYRVCTRNFDCQACDFELTVQEKLGGATLATLDQALSRLKGLPGSQRLCRYALEKCLSDRAGGRLFHCEQCEFTQITDEAFRQKLTCLEARREALRSQEKGKGE